MSRFLRLFSRLQQLAFAALVALYPLLSVNGQTLPENGKGKAVADPATRSDLKSEMELPDASPPLSPVVPNDKTLLNYSERTLSERNIDSIKAEMEAARDELVKTKQMIDEVMKEQKQLAKGRELPPLEGGVINSFPLKNVPASDVVETIDSLFGSQGLRVAVDKRTNSLIIYGTPVLVNAVDALLTKIEERADLAKPAVSTVTSSAPTNRTLMLRVFWLADGVQGLDGPEGYLPSTVIGSLAKLGIASPRLVTQTVTSISVEENAGAARFSTQVPAALFDQPMQMVLSGDLSATADNRSLVDVQLTIQGDGDFCSVKGSLAAPIGHFMVLGTANSVIADNSAGEMGGGGMAMGRGMEGAEGMGRSMPMGRGMEGGGGTGVMEMPAAAPKFNSTRFAFVVQVVEAESFAPEE